MKPIEDFFKILKLSAELVEDKILLDKVKHIQECLENLKQNETIKQIVKEMNND